MANLAGEMLDACKGRDKKDTNEYAGYGGSILTGEPESTSCHALGAFSGEGKYPDAENPQFLLTLPPGPHNVNIKVTRSDMNRDDALILVLYKANPDGSGRWYKTPPESSLISKSAYKKQFSAIVMVGLEVQEGETFIVMTATNNPKASGPFSISVLTDGCGPRLEALGAQVCRLDSSWTEERSGGYCKADNPQFLLNVPEGEHMVFVELERSDQSKDQGLILFVFPYEGSNGERISFVRKDMALFASKFKSSDSVSIKETFKAGQYMILACLQKIGTTGPLNIDTKAESFKPEVVELTGGEVEATKASDKAAASPAKAASPAGAAGACQVTADGSWKGDKAAGYKKVGNPQFLLSLPKGEHNLQVQVERKEEHGGEGLILFVYKYSGKGARMTKLTNGAIAGQTPYRVTTRVDEAVTLVGGPNKYMLMPCLKTPGAEGRFTITVSGESDQMDLKCLGQKEHGAVVSHSEWAEGTTGGYMKPNNPQFLVELPEGKQDVTFTVKRTDGQADQGLICLVYEHGGDGELVEPEGEDGAMPKAHHLKGKSDFKKADSVVLSKKLDGFPNKYLVLPCLQEEGALGPMTLTVEADKCIPLLTNMRCPEELSSELEADLKKVAAAAAPKKKKFAAVEPPPED